jgi:uncharacterized protein (DUF488 family)
VRSARIRSLTKSRVYTIGHSRHAAEHFVALLHTHTIERLVDVRSHPVSKWAPHFGRVALAQLLLAHAVDYVFLGDALGGRPNGALYRDDGSVDYERRAAAPDFVIGIQQLVALSHDRRTTILCAEEDPMHCHRRLLVTPALFHAGADVVHIRGDGRLEPERASVEEQQLDLFGTSAFAGTRARAKT